MTPRKGIPCLRQCWVCGCLVRMTLYVCDDCAPLVYRIAEAHAQTPAPVYPPDGHEKRIARYERLAALGQPLTAA